MRQSWDDGDFWTVCAARKNFAFDDIFWRRLDPKFFGAAEPPEDAWMGRLSLLDRRAKQDMESFVEKKLKDDETRVLAWEPNEDIAKLI